MKRCANCNKEITDDYYMVGDNYLQANYFDELDGSDNCFCSQECLCEALSVICVDVEEVKGERMKIKATGTNYWGLYKTYLHESLKEQPTPMFANNIFGIQISSRVNFVKFNEPKEVELQKGDYVMLITADDWKRDKDRACGHMHYFDGRNLISVYTKKKYEVEGEQNERNYSLN